MRTLPKVLAVAGVVYLVVVGALYIVLTGRVAHFRETAPSVTGTIVRIEPHVENPSWGFGGRRLVETPVIAYTIDGHHDEIVAEGWSNVDHRVGDHVTLIYDAGDPLITSDDLVLIKDQHSRGLAAAAPVFFVLAAGAAWIFAAAGVWSRRRRPERQRTPASPQLARS